MPPETAWWYVLLGVVVSPILWKLWKSFVSTARQAQEAPSTRLVVRLTPEVRTRIEALQRRVGRVMGEPCDTAQLLRMSLATLDMLEQEERLEYEDGNPVLVLDLDDEGEAAEEPPRRPEVSRWDVLGADEEEA